MKQGVVIASQSSIQIVYRASTTLLLIPNLYTLSLLPNCPEDLIRQDFNTCDQLNCVLC
jgi:hypothetical protein